MTIFNIIKKKLNQGQDVFIESQTPKVGIVGSKGVGKSYLFQAMVYRASSGSHAGALAYFLEDRAIQLYSTFRKDSRMMPENLHLFIENYKNYVRLPQTLAESQKWYRLRLQFKSGFLGLGASYLEVDFFDSSGELIAAPLNPANVDVWNIYENAKIMVFCLPFWVAFPDSQLPETKRHEAEEILSNYTQVVQNYYQIKEIKHNQKNAHMILALTMADDNKLTRLKDIHSKWISSYIVRQNRFLKSMKKGWALGNYLSHAKEVSAYLWERLTDPDNNPLYAHIPQQLWAQGASKPWLIPVSSIEGNYIDSNDYQRAASSPVHVELPLLLALCDQTNAFM